MTIEDATAAKWQGYGSKPHGESGEIVSLTSLTNKQQVKKKIGCRFY